MRKMTIQERRPKRILLFGVFGPFSADEVHGSKHGLAVWATP